MDATASQTTSLTIVYSTFYSGADERKHQSSASLALICVGDSPVIGEFPAQMTNNAENASICWVIIHIVRGCICNCKWTRKLASY